MMKSKLVQKNILKEHKLILKFRFIYFFGNFYSLECVATSMNHNAFQWVEIATLI